MTKILLTGKRCRLPYFTSRITHYAQVEVVSLLLIFLILSWPEGHSVVTTVRSQQKVQQIKDAHQGLDKAKLDFAIVEDIAHEDGNVHGVHPPILSLTLIQLSTEQSYLTPHSRLLSTPLVLITSTL